MTTWSRTSVDVCTCVCLSVCSKKTKGLCEDQVPGCTLRRKCRSKDLRGGSCAPTGDTWQGDTLMGSLLRVAVTSKTEQRQRHALFTSHVLTTISHALITRATILFRNEDVLRTTVKLEPNYLSINGHLLLFAWAKNMGYTLYAYTYTTCIYIQNKNKTSMNRFSYIQTKMNNLEKCRLSCFQKSRYVQ